MNPKIVEHIKAIVELAGTELWELIDIEIPAKWRPDQTIKVQILSRTFLRWFDEYEITVRMCETYPYELSKTINGVKVFCVTSKKELEGVKNDTK